MDDENCRSLSGFTDSTEQSAPVNFDMSNRVSASLSIPIRICRIISDVISTGKTSKGHRKYPAAFGKCRQRTVTGIVVHRLFSKCNT